MSDSRPDPILALKKRLREGALHHGILLLGQGASAVENAALVLAQKLLSMDQETLAHPDLFTYAHPEKQELLRLRKQGN